MDMTRRRAAALLAALLTVTLPVASAAATSESERFITVASTTSTENSGLFRHLLPLFTAKTGVEVRVVALGTGQALDVGRRGDADIVFVHDAAAEQQFVTEGHGIDRREVMYNDFVLVGPASDPARIAGSRDIAASLAAILATESPFVSRGDRSGTHAAELRLWAAAGIDISARKGPWYREVGSGMGATLNTAAALDAYTLSDRGTWLSFANRRDLRIVVEGDRRLFNQYGVILVSPARHPHVKETDARTFIDWLVSAEGQSAIAGFRINGEQAFFPNAKRTWEHGRD
jgi:tungstate transport system substrate-binding protein